MKNNLPLVVFAASGLLLSACAQLTNISKPTGTNDQCLQMQREMVFRNTDHNHDAASITRQQQQAYTAKYNALCK